MCSGWGVSSQGQSSMEGLKVYGGDRGSGTVARGQHVMRSLGSQDWGQRPGPRGAEGSIQGF